MKILIIYYSLDGHTEAIANIIKNHLNADIIKLLPEHDIKDKKGFAKYLWGGKSVVLKEKPALQNDFSMLNSYDKIFIGSPLWAANIPPAINALLCTQSFDEVYLFSSFMGSGADKFLKNFQSKSPNTKILSFKAFKQSKDDNSDEIIAWLKSLDL